MGLCVLSTGPAYLSACAPAAIVCNTADWTITPRAAGAFFDCHSMSVLSDVADLIVGHGDAPSAQATGALNYIDTMIEAWAGPSIKWRLTRLAGFVDDFAVGALGQPYAVLPVERREQLLAEFDAEAFANDEALSSMAYRDFKELFLRVYFTSAETNREYVRLPGEYLGDISEAEHFALLRANAESFVG